MKYKFDKDQYEKSIAGAGQGKGFISKIVVLFSYIKLWFFFLCSWVLVGLIFPQKDMKNSVNDLTMNSGELKFIIPFFIFYLVLSLIIYMSQLMPDDYFGIKRNFFKKRKYFVGVLKMFSIVGVLKKK